MSQTGTEGAGPAAAPNKPRTKSVITEAIWRGSKVSLIMEESGSQIHVGKNEGTNSIQSIEFTRPTVKLQCERANGINR